MTKKYANAQIIYVDRKDQDKWFYPEEEYKKFLTPTIVFIDLKHSFSVLFFNEGAIDYNENLTVDELFEVYNKGSGKDIEIKILEKELKQMTEMLVRRL
jgi:hypothetical protein